MKKIISAIAMLAIGMTIIGASVYAEAYTYPLKSAEETANTSGKCGENLFWYLQQSDGGLTLIISGTGEMEEYPRTNWEDFRDQIRKVIIEEGVTSTGKHSFYDCKNLTTVSLPSTLKKIGWGTFLQCYALKEVNIPKSVTSIEQDAFACCSSLTQIELPPSLTILERGILESCTSLTKIEIPQNVTTLKACVFMGCKNLKEVTLPNGLKSIGLRSFCECRSLRKLVIPDTVSNIEYLAFEFCDLTLYGKKGLAAEKYCLKGKAPVNECDLKFVDPTLIEYAKVADIEDYEYMSKNIKPDPVVTLGVDRLIKGKDYNVIYKNNMNAGTATIIFEGEGNIRGTIKKTFKIKPITISYIAIPKIYPKTWTGKKICPGVTVRYEDTVLKKGRDYTTTYKNNIQTGQATIIIKGKGSCKGKITTHFNIVPKGCTLKKITRDKKNVYLSWTYSKKQDARYEFEYSTTKNFSKHIYPYPTLKKGKLTINIEYTGLKPGKTYYFRVRARKDIIDRTYYSKWSNVQSVKLLK